VHIFLFDPLDQLLLALALPPSPAGFEMGTISDDDFAYQPGVVSG